MTRPVTRPAIARDALGTLTKLGQGGQGIVHQAPTVKTQFANAMVFKEYKPQARTEVDFAALAAMPTLVEDTLSDDDGRGLVSIAAWPCALVETGTGSVGFVMPAIPDSFYIDLTTVKGVSRTRAEFQHLLNPPSVLAARGITITDTQRYQLLREVAKALAFLHRVGVCVGDISPKNLLFSLHPHPAVYFIDCDAMCVNGVSVLPQVETPEWEVPTGEPLATLQSDTYKLGLLALRLLTGDQHTKDVHQLPPTTPKLLRQLIADTLTNDPDRRPLPEAWTYLLGHAIEGAQHRAPTPYPPKPAPPTHVPELQPVVRSRPTATSPTGKPVAAKVSAQSAPASTGKTPAVVSTQPSRPAQIEPKRQEGTQSGTMSRSAFAWLLVGIVALSFSSVFIVGRADYLFKSWSEASLRGAIDRILDYTMLVGTVPGIALLVRGRSQSSFSHIIAGCALVSIGTSTLIFYLLFTYVESGSPVAIIASLVALAGFLIGPSLVIGTLRRVPTRAAALGCMLSGGGILTLAVLRWSHLLYGSGAEFIGVIVGLVLIVSSVITLRSTRKLAAP